MTAMIDVIFLLIIFFMTTAQFIERARAEVELPEEHGEEIIDARIPPLIINILAEPVEPFVVGEDRMELLGVKNLIDRELARLRTDGHEASEFEVVIRADERGASRNVNQLGTHLRERGIWRWRLATQPPQ